MMGYTLSFLQEGFHSNKQPNTVLLASLIISQKIMAMLHFCQNLVEYEEIKSTPKISSLILGKKFYYLPGQPVLALGNSRADTISTSK